jgi:hypothetical protein
LPINKGAEAEAVAHVFQGKNILRLFSGQVQPTGTGPGGDDQPIIGPGNFPAPVAVQDPYPACAPVNGQGLMPQLDFDLLLFLKFFRGPGD